MSIRIYHDDLVEANWFQSLDTRLQSAQLREIGSRGQNPPAIDELVVYDRPDIVLESDGEPVLMVEKTREVPTGHNVGQRFPRFVRSAEVGVPAIKFVPFNAMKHGTHGGVCSLNIRMLKAFENMRSIHDTNLLAVEWPADSEGELIGDGSENKRISTLITEFLNSGLNQFCKEFEDQYKRNRNQYSDRLNDYPKYGSPPPSAKIRSTNSVLKENSDKSHIGSVNDLREKEETLVYTIEMSPGSCRREDPYVGTQFIYDYNNCRYGEGVCQKNRNLVINFPKIKRKTFRDKNPNDPDRKSLCWYLTANALMYKDSIELLRV